ncbi:unnamed protein product [Sphagnum balticum]
MTVGDCHRSIGTTFKMHLFRLSVGWASSSSLLVSTGGGGVGVAAPNYLSVVNYQLCVGQMQPMGSTSSSVCLPLSQPQGCPMTTWTQLQGLLPSCLLSKRYFDVRLPACVAAGILLCEFMATTARPAGATATVYK